MGKKKLNSTKYCEQLDSICGQAYHAMLDLLESCGEKSYIATTEDYSYGLYTPEWLTVKIIAVGLDENGKLWVAGIPANDEVGTNFSKDWVDFREFLGMFIPYLYQFVESNIDKAMTKDEADKFIKDFFKPSYNLYATIRP